MSVKPTGLLAVPVSPYPYSFTQLPSGAWVPFSVESPFNKKVVSPTIKTESAAWIGKVEAHLKSQTAFNSSPIETYDHPVYFSLPTDPLHKIEIVEEPEGEGKSSAANGLEIHIPTGAKPASGTDLHMCVVDQASGKAFSFWQVLSGTVGASGVIKANACGYELMTGTGIDEKGAAVAAGYSLISGIIRPEELVAGAINHALFLVTEHTNGNVAPSISNGKPSVAGWPPMGGRFWLESTNGEIEAMSIPSWQKTILRCLHEYGAYVGDRGGGVFKMLDAHTYTSAHLTNPLTTYGQAHEGEKISVALEEGEYRAYYTMTALMTELLTANKLHFIA